MYFCFWLRPGAFLNLAYVCFSPPWYGSPHIAARSVVPCRHVAKAEPRIRCLWIFLFQYTAI